VLDTFHSFCQILRTVFFLLFVWCRLISKLDMELHFETQWPYNYNNILLLLLIFYFGRATRWPDRLCRTRRGQKLCTVVYYFNFSLRSYKGCLFGSVFFYFSVMEVEGWNSRIRTYYAANEFLYGGDSIARPLCNGIRYCNICFKTQ